MVRSAFYCSDDAARLPSLLNLKIRAVLNAPNFLSKCFLSGFSKTLQIRATVQIMHLLLPRMKSSLALDRPLLGLLACGIEAALSKIEHRLVEFYRDWCSLVARQQRGVNRSMSPPCLRSVLQNINHSDTMYVAYINVWVTVRIQSLNQNSKLNSRHKGVKRKSY